MSKKISPETEAIWVSYITVLRLASTYISGKYDYTKIARQSKIKAQLVRQFIHQGIPKAHRKAGAPNKGKPIHEVLLSMGQEARSQLEGHFVDKEEKPPSRKKLKKMDDEIDMDSGEVLSTLNKANQKALQDAVKSRIEAGKTVRLMRTNANGLLGYSAVLMRTLAPVAKGLIEAAEIGDMTVSERLKVLKTVAEFASISGAVADKANKLEESALGTLSGSIEGMEDVADDLSSEEALAILESASAALEMAKKEGNLKEDSVEADIDEFVDHLATTREPKSEGEDIKIDPDRIINSEVVDE